MNDQRRGKPFILTAHAVVTIAERGIDVEWLQRVLNQPSRVEQDRSDPTLRHALGRVAEREGRVLRVIYNDREIPWRIVTASGDRAQKDKP